MQDFSGNNGSPIAKRARIMEQPEVDRLPEDVNEEKEDSIRLPEPVLPVRKGFLQDPSAPQMAGYSDEEDSDPEEDSEAPPVHKPFHRDPTFPQMEFGYDDEDSDSESVASEASEEGSEAPKVFKPFRQDPTFPQMEFGSGSDDDDSDIESEVENDEEKNEDMMAKLDNFWMTYEDQKKEWEDALEKCKEVFEK